MEGSEALERLRQNVARVRETLLGACQRVGRDPDGVRLVAITKYADLGTVRRLLELGVRDLGENRVQQLVERAECLGSAVETPFESAAGDAAIPRWHMVGHLQRNKVKVLLRQARIIHSLDSVRLAREIENTAERLELTADALIEVNVAGEASKTGAAAAELDELAEVAQACRHLQLRGLMTMAPYDPDPEASRPCFARLRELLEGLGRRGIVGPSCRHLSMGMTQDYAVAVEEGATLVRIGSALYEDLPQLGSATE